MPRKSATQSIPVLRPRDAATLIILKKVGKRREVLIGKRHQSHKFMPRKYVFPGGRVDYADSRVRPVCGLPPEETGKLLIRMAGTPSPNRARAMAMAAVRETFEETGIALGRRIEGRPVRSKSAAWQQFLDTGVRPDLSGLHFIARAITPPGRPRRYDTRFFLTRSEDWKDVSFEATASDELTEVHWMRLADARELDVPRVTRFVLDKLADCLTRPPGDPSRQPVPFFYHRGNAWIQDHL